MQTETYIINANIKELYNEIKISNILLNINHYKLYFNPILEHNIPPLLQNIDEFDEINEKQSFSSSYFHKENNNQNIPHSRVKYKNTKILIINKKCQYMIEKESRDLLVILPLIYKNEILDYLNKTIDLLLTNNIFTPLNNKTIQFDIINKIPIIIDFKKAIIITKWQDKNEFNKKYYDDINKLIWNTLK